MTAPYITGLVAIETTYRGPTDTRGSRIVARTANGQRLVRSYDHALDGPENHAAAAAALQARLVEAHTWARPYRLIGGATRDGMAFVLFHSDTDEGI